MDRFEILAGLNLLGEKDPSYMAVRDLLIRHRDILYMLEEKGFETIDEVVAVILSK